MASFFKKIVKTANTISNVRSVTNAVRTGNVGTVASTVLDVALSQRNINAQLNSISGFGGSLTSTRLGSGRSQLGGILDIASGLTGGRFDNILSGALELEGLINSPIRVVDRSAAEIFNAAGGRFDAIRQQVSNLADLNVYDSFIKNIDSNLSPPINNSGAAASRIPNPLRTFSSYNYKITMGILSNKEYNNPETYRSLGFEQYIIRSAGGDLGRRTQTDQEATSPQPGHAEYFIDYFVYDGVVAPNP